MSKKENVNFMLFDNKVVTLSFVDLSKNDSTDIWKGEVLGKMHSLSLFTRINDVVRGSIYFMNEDLNRYEEFKIVSVGDSVHMLVELQTGLPGEQ